MDYFSFIKNHRVMLAPMAGVSDVAFRQICSEHGAQLAFTEMVSAKGLSYANERTAHLVDLYDGEQQVGVQIFGHEPETMTDQAKWLEQELGEHLAVIDINMGCPVRKIAGKGDGAALMKDPALASSIIEAVAGAVSVPVSVKFRRGFYQNIETAPEFACMAQDAGASWVCVHGRFAQQMYTGASERACIARVKEAVRIPVIGNGDVRTGADARALMQETACDAVLVARGAQGNPWIFERINAALTGAPEPAAPTPHERIALARRHMHLLAAHDVRSVVRMRKHACWYVKGIPGAAAARSTFNACTTAKDFDAAFDALEARVGADECS